MTRSRRSALEDAQVEDAAHAGLVLSRYLEEPYNGDEHEKARKQLFQQSIDAANGAKQVYAQAHRRWKRSIPEPNATKIVKTTGRVILGLGSESVLEAGIRLHHTYGLPVLPGTALKGLASSYCHEVWGRDDAGFRGRGGPDDDGIGSHYHVLFGDQDQAGRIVFHDGWLDPAVLDQEEGPLVHDVLTPHHQEYYGSEGDKPPTDFDDPRPVRYLSVTGRFMLAVSCPIAVDEAQGWADLALDLLLEALKHRGLGGKTSSGYGRMVRVDR